MKTLFLGGDQRYLEIIKHFEDKEYEIDVVGYENAPIGNKVNKIEINNVNIGLYDIIFLPIGGVKENYQIECVFSDKKVVLNKDIFNGIKEKSLIFTGIKTKRLSEMLENVKANVTYLLDDKEILKENSVATAEGTIGDIIFNTNHTINGSNIFILGYGNIGKELTDKLIGLGANVTVGVILFDDFRKLMEKQINCIYTFNQFLMEKIISNSDVIINTVPKLIIDEHYLKSANKDVYLLDVASKHGFDIDKAQELQLKNKMFRGIPGIVAPKTIGNALVKKIDSNLERSN